MKKISFKFAVVCDDIRREDNGKFMIIGAYAAELIVSEFPAPLVLSAFIPFEAEKKESFDLEFQVLIDGQRVYKASGRIEVVSGEPPLIDALPILRILMTLNGEGTIEFQAREKDKEWETVRRLPVKKRPVSSSAPTPPS